MELIEHLKKNNDMNKLKELKSVIDERISYLTKEKVFNILNLRDENNVEIEKELMDLEIAGLQIAQSIDELSDVYS